MITMHPDAGLPPLPSSWPFAPRAPGPAAEAREGVALPGLEGTWTLTAVPGLDLSADPAPLGGAFGRGGVFRCGGVVLRPYRRGGLVRLINERVYPGTGRFQGEYRVHRALWEAGLPTVEPLGWASRPRAWGAEGVFLSRFEEGAPLPRSWDPAAPAQIRTILEALCAWGLFAPDLNATNFHVLPGGRVLALDWDRALWLPGEPLMPRYQERLARSLRKLDAPLDFVI